MKKIRKDRHQRHIHDVTSSLETSSRELSGE